jgi:predicted RNA-binding protein with PUA domain
MNEEIEGLHPIFWCKPCDIPIPQSPLIQVSLKETNIEYEPVYDQSAIRLAFEAGMELGRSELRNELDSWVDRRYLFNKIP